LAHRKMGIVEIGHNPWGQGEPNVSQLDSQVWQMFGNSSYACPELHGVAQTRRRSRERT